MIPDFSTKTTELIAKRAGFKCSNPDCRKATIGPNTDPNRVTSIGEAAHIFGAREKSKRYRADMSDSNRAEITNAIWLCRNCHKLIDTDEYRYSSNVLFKWREIHEKYILSELGNETDHIHQEEQEQILSQFTYYPPLIRRIVIDRPVGWEWRLAAELLRALNEPLFRKINDLSAGLYIKPYTHLEREALPDWVRKKLAESQKIIQPFHGLFKLLNESLGPPGVSGKPEEIHHACKLISNHLEQIIQYEETLYFTIVPEKHEKLLTLMKGNISSQAQKINEIPETYDYIVSILGTEFEGTKEEPYVIEREIVFELPQGWSEDMERELEKLRLELE